MRLIHEQASLFTPAAPRLGRRNRGYARMFAPERLTLGLMYPVESFPGDAPSMRGQLETAQRAEAAGFAALWVRDVPLRVPSFGDTGQVYDPWVWLALLASRTSSIALATGAIVLPLRHPIHVAKAAASIDRLSGGRLVLGVASGDRPAEFAAFGIDMESRGEIFRERFDAVRTLLETEDPDIAGAWGEMSGMDLVPKPYGAGIPMLVTGQSRQPCEWIAENADGWITYPRDASMQRRVIASWRELSSLAHASRFAPFAQSLYIDLERDAYAPRAPIHLGYRLGRMALLEVLSALRHAGANHVALNLKYGQRPADEVVDEIATHVLPNFSTPSEEAA